MNKKIVALAVAAAFAIPAAASAQTTLYGQFKYEVGYIDDGNDSNLVHSTKGTRIGVRGAEDLGGGLQGIFRLQGSFAGVNTSLAANDWTMNEEAWVGLQGGFGRLLVGRSDSAVKNASKPFRIFGDTLADTNNRPGGWQRAEGIHYTTPNFGGVTVGATIEPNGVETDAYFALNAIYKNGPMFVSAAYEASPDDGTYAVGEIGPDESNYQFGASWNFGPGDVGVLYQARNDGDDTVLVVPVNFKVLPSVNLRAALQYYDEDETGDDFTNYALGAQYMLSSRTEIFANLWSDDRAGSTPLGADEMHFGAGVRHAF